MTSQRPLRLGARPDPLARWRAAHLSAILGEQGIAAELVPLEPQADTPDEDLLRAIVTKQIDLAVHALEELPVALPRGLAIVAVGGREDPRDAIVGHEPVDWLELPSGATIAASGARRRGQLLAARPDLDVVDVGGALPDRIARLDATPGWAALVATLANLLRLGLSDRVSDRLDPMLVVPAPGQGALVVTAPRGDMRLLAPLRAAMHDPATAVATAAERAFLRELGGDTRRPVAAYAIRDETSGGLRLHGRVVTTDGTAVAEAVRLGPVADGDESAAEALGVAAAHDVRARGAEAILEH